ncbi:MAG: TldD/PmbA family protein [Thermodesulfobacteriota bacterium]
MKTLTRSLLNKAANAGVEHADVRVEKTEGANIRVARTGETEIKATHEAGYSVRVLVDGVWGFAAGQDTSDAGLDEVVTRAVTMARAAALFTTVRVKLAPAPVVNEHWATPVAKDPFQVGPDQKIGLLEAAVRAADGQHILRAAGTYTESRQTKYFANSEGSFIEQELIECGGGLMVFATNGREIQRRTYPGMVFGDIGSRGFEYFEGLDLPGQAPRLAREAEMLLSAKTYPPKKTTIVIDPRHMALQVHESAGHPSELDRVFGFEKTLAGGTFLGPDKLDRFRYGSELVNITADATVPGGRGTFGYDDEGIPAQRVELIRAGVFVNYLSSRETAARIGRTSSGAARADAWNRYPLVRMTNINLEPGESTLEELIGQVDEGLYLESSKMWSIDGLRLNFQFGTELGREIKNGKLGDFVKNPTYSGITPVFWAGCDGVGDKDTWRLTGFACAKGEPLQFGIRVGHGAPAARFRNVQVGV